MVDVMPMSSLAQENQENMGPKSAGKRTRERDTGSCSKRRALTSLSNQLSTIQERRQSTKEPFKVCGSATKR